MAHTQDTEVSSRGGLPGQGLLLTTLALLALGVVMVFSALARPEVREMAWYARVDIRHAMFAAAAALVLLVGWRFNYHHLNKGRWIWPATTLLGLSMLTALLVHVPGIGHHAGYSARFIQIIPHVGFQPSELMKLALVIFLSAWLGRETTNVKSFWRTFVPAVGLIGVSVGLIIAEDFSTGAVAGLAAAATLLLAGVPWYYLATLVPPAAAGVYYFVYDQAYRWNRILAWLDPWSMDNKASYQPRQSLLAILTGGWTGKGLGNGTIKNGYLPESSTDFIFSVYCEELGFIGAVLLIGLVMLWIWHARKAALRAGDKFGMLLAGSLGLLTAVQSVLHIAVALVTAPTTGMGLPFVSAGGTALVTAAGSVALMVSVSSARGRSVEATGELQPALELTPRLA